MRTVVRDPVFEPRSPGFEAVVGDRPRLSRLVGVDAHEGPVYFADEDALYFTTLPRPKADGSPWVQVKRFALDQPEEVSVLVGDANAANGMTADRNGDLIVCEQGSHAEPARISRLDRTTGRCEPVVEHWRGLSLNSPNDVTAGPGGELWFTDPAYGHLQGFRPEPQVGDFVYRQDPSGQTTVVADGFDKPNGIALTPDGRVLYVTDSGANQAPGSYHVDRPHHIKAFDVVEGRRLSGERLFAVVTPGFPDGLKVDREGRVYSSSASGVQVFDPAGALLGEIRLPGAVNFCFAGAERNLLLITTDSAVWAAELAAKGA